MKSHYKQCITKYCQMFNRILTYISMYDNRFQRIALYCLALPLYCPKVCLKQKF